MTDQTVHGSAFPYSDRADLDLPSAERDAQRLARLKSLVAEFGRADDCTDVEEFDGTHGFVLMEADGRGNQGGKWWSFGPNAEWLLERSAGQECLEDWPAETVFDLDSNQCWEVELSYKVGAPIEVGPLDGEAVSR